MPKQVYGDNGAGLRCDRRGDLFGIKAVGGIFHIDKDRDATIGDRGHRRCRHGPGRDDDLVSRRDTDGTHGRDQPGGCRFDRHSMAAFKEFAPFVFERPNGRATQKLLAG